MSHWSSWARSFNPCFRGTCSWCPKFLAWVGSNQNVSILVFVELALDERAALKRVVAYMEFQSLFSWNLLLMNIHRDLQCRQPGVSILVFVELALDVCQNTKGRYAHIGVSILVFVELALDVLPSACSATRARSFQSLFSWNLLLMYILKSLKGFTWNVSILVFVELALDAQRCRVSCYREKFQSLFSWNLLLMNKPKCNMSAADLCFNPCFRGTCSWCQIPKADGMCPTAVSILVFVELALDVRHALAGDHIIE